MNNNYNSDDLQQNPDSSMNLIYDYICSKPILRVGVSERDIISNSQDIRIRLYLKQQEGQLEIENLNVFWRDDDSFADIPVIDDFDNNQKRFIRLVQSFCNGECYDLSLNHIQFSFLLNEIESAGIELFGLKQRNSIPLILDKTIKFHVVYSMLNNNKLRLSTSVSDPDNEDKLLHDYSIISGSPLWLFNIEQPSFYKLDKRINEGFIEDYTYDDVILEKNEIAHILNDDFLSIKDLIILEKANSETNNISIETATPKISLKLDLNNDRITAVVNCDYSGLNFKHPDFSVLDEFYQEDEDNMPLTWIRRDMAAETKLLSFLRNECGFTCGKNYFYLDDESLSYEFMYFKIKKIENDYVIKFSDELKNIYKEDALVVPEISFTSIDTDWLSFDVKFSENGKDLNISVEDIRANLQAGLSYIKLNNGGIVPIAKDKFETFDELYSEYANESGKLAITHSPFLLDQFKSKGFNIECDENIKDLYQKLKGFKSIQKVELDKNVDSTLRDYQKAGVDWMGFLREYGFGGILADDMGIGKTLQALTIMTTAMKQDKIKPSLVICPTTLVWNWQAELDKFFPNLKVLAMHGQERHESFNEIKNVDIVITSYALIRRDIDFYEEFSFCYIVLDEAQSIKNKNTLSAKAVKKLNGKYRLALTGTPLENSIMDIWSIFDFLMPAFLGRHGKFRRMYETPITKKNNVEKLQELAIKVKPFMLRRLKTDVLDELPEKIEQVSFCDLDPLQARLYAEMASLAKADVLSAYKKDGYQKSRMKILTAILRLRQICCHPALIGSTIEEQVNESGKFNLLQELVSEALSGGHKLVIFSQFTKMLKLIEDYFAAENIKYEYMDGQTKDRKERINSFNNDDSVKVFLLSLKVGGVGLNLTSADTVILYEPWWNPAVENQAVDRVHRIGQTLPVSAYRLIAKGTIEEKIMHLQEKKKNLMDSLIISEKDISKSLSWNDIKFLLDL